MSRRPRASFAAAAALVLVAVACAAAPAAAQDATFNNDPVDFEFTLREATCLFNCNDDEDLTTVDTLQRPSVILDYPVDASSLQAVNLDYTYSPYPVDIFLFSTSGSVLDGLDCNDGSCLDLSIRALTFPTFTHDCELSSDTCQHFGIRSLACQPSYSSATQLWTRNCGPATFDQFRSLADFSHPTGFSDAPVIRDIVNGFRSAGGVPLVVEKHFAIGLTTLTKDEALPNFLREETGNPKFPVGFKVQIRIPLGETQGGASLWGWMTGGAILSSGAGLYAYKRNVDQRHEQKVTARRERRRARRRGAGSNHGGSADDAAARSSSAGKAERRAGRSASPSKASRGGRSGGSRTQPV